MRIRQNTQTAANVLKRRSSGFTIVELLIVIVVIGILSVIAISSFSSAQTRARNSARYQEMQDWRKVFEQYKAAYGTLPNGTTNDGYCLGTGFPSAKCRDYQGAVGPSTYSEANSAALITELRKVGNLPAGERIPVRGTVGPYVIYFSSAARIISVFNGASDDCPTTTTYNWDDGAGRLLCSIDITY